MSKYSKDFIKTRETTEYICPCEEKWLDDMIERKVYL